MPFGRVGIGCDSLSSAALQIKSQEPSLRGIIYYPPAPPKGDFNLLARFSSEVCCTPLTLRSAHIFRGLAEQRDCDFRSYVRSSHRRSSRRLAQRKILVSGLAIRRCGQFPRYAETVRIPLVPRSSVQTLLRSTALRGVI